MWEETIIYCPPRIQLLCLSATVGNPDDLAGWIQEVHCRGRQRCDTIVSDYRPVPLNWHFSMKPGRMWPGLGPLLSRRGDQLNPELFPFTKEGVRNWNAANGGGGSGGSGGGGGGEWGVSDEQDGSYEGGFYRKQPRFQNDGGRRGGAGGARGGGSGSRSRGGRSESGEGSDYDPRGGRGGGGGRGSGGGRGYGGFAPPPSPANDRQMRRRLVPHVETTVGPEP